MFVVGGDGWFLRVERERERERESGVCVEFMVIERTSILKQRERHCLGANHGIERGCSFS